MKRNISNTVYSAENQNLYHDITDETMANGYGSMFNRDYYGLTSEPTNSHIPGGVTPTRPALMRQQYLDEKRARLAAEAAERQRQEINGFKQRMAVICVRLVKATFTAFKVAKLKLSNVSRNA